MKMGLILLCTISGAALFIYLFVKFLRKGVSDRPRGKCDHFFLHGIEVRKKVWTDPSYLAHFVALMIALMSFAASIAFLLQHFLAGQK